MRKAILHFALWLIWQSRPTGVPPQKTGDSL